MSRVLDEIDQAVIISTKIAGIVIAAAAFMAAVLPPAELDDVCDRLWSKVKRRYFTEED